MKILAFVEVMMRMMCDDHKMLSQTDVFHAQYTGTGVNICAGLYQMGEEVYVVTTLPNHHVGKAAVAHLRKLGIKDDFIRFQGDHIGIYFLEQGIGNRASHVTYLNRKDSSFALASYSDEEIKEMLQGMDALHICGIALAMSERTRACALSFARIAKSLGITIFFDCNFRPSLWHGHEQDAPLIYQEMAALADVLFASYRDGEHLGIDMNVSVQEILNAIREKFQVKVIYGSNRLENELYQGYEVNQDGYYTSTPYKLTVFDRIGGGDAFAAGAIYGYFHIQDTMERINFATVSGVLGHTTYGDSPVLDLEEIKRYFIEGPKDILR